MSSDSDTQEVLCLIHGMFEVPADEWKWECPTCKQIAALDALWDHSE